MPRCHKCEKEKTFEEFPVAGKNRNGVMRYRKLCKTCWNSQNRKANRSARTNPSVSGNHEWMPTARDLVEIDELRKAEQRGIDDMSEAEWQRICYQGCKAKGMCDTRAR